MILNKKFSTELSGYNATEVDLFFDKVIEDYNYFEDQKNIQLETVAELRTIISDREDEIRKLNMEIINLKEQLKKTEKATNVELMKEVRDLKLLLNNKK